MKSVCYRMASLALTMSIISSAPSNAQGWQIERPSYKEIDRRIVAGEDVPFDYVCSPGFQIVSGGYEILGIEGGNRANVKVLASTVDVPNNRYHVKLSHALPYGGGAHPMVSARISGTCVKLPSTPAVPANPTVPRDPADQCVLTKAAIDAGVELRGSSINILPNGMQVSCQYGSNGMVSGKKVELRATCPKGTLLDFPGYFTTKVSNFQIAGQQLRSDTTGMEESAILLQPDGAGLRFELSVLAMCR